MGIKVESAAYSSIGGRRNNEDNFYLNGIFLKRDQMDKGGKISSTNTQQIQLYAVLDGMGGGDFGEQASFCAANSIKEYQDKSEHIDNSDNLRRFLTETSRKIDRISEENGLKSGSCGSTIAMVIIGDWWFRAAHVGDSRVYLLRDGKICRVTKDQSEVQRMVDAGKITLEEAFYHPRKNIITHHLGMPLRTGNLQSIIGDRMPLNVGDVFLICSDGVSDYLRDNDIASIIGSSESVDNIARFVVNNAKRSADQMNMECDNITAIVLRVRQVADSRDQEKRFKRMVFRHRLAVVGTILFALTTIASIALMLLR